MMALTLGALTFFDRESWPAGEQPYELLFQPPDPEFPTRNYNVTQIDNIPIHDVRALKGKLSLDREGFIVADLNTKMQYEDFFDQNQIMDIYIPEVKNFLIDKLGARASYIHECVIRQAKGHEGQTGTFGQPIQNVHTDYTHEYALELVETITENEEMAQRIRKSRMQMLNVWKPLRGPLKSWPLALCDLQSLQRRDIVTFDEVHATAVLQSQQVVYDPSQKWYYLSDQRADEIIVFKSMDSQVKGEVAHGSFDHPDCPSDEPPRQSIELRVLVVY